eukprot:CAMPEP_0118979362 /NCGR_PEP_ID=MMETSP1173-20130426/25783_1 /TAXON_ID=1034831 /ORGANISM="Rhizochromulina marina cf, Strain CCMP1243" /LENGTH=116 /DNA_ID=CAMNT_0006929619 /DNA_START=281 /DNA_END=631 /DNA_ORIENTATION=-
MNCLSPCFLDRVVKLEFIGAAKALEEFRNLLVWTRAEGALTIDKKRIMVFQLEQLAEKLCHRRKFLPPCDAELVLFHDWRQAAYGHELDLDFLLSEWRRAQHHLLAAALGVLSLGS